MFMKQFVDAPLEFIYTTPDENEEEIFEDHFEVVKSMNPAHVIVVPGRKSIDKAREYYEIIKKEYPDAEFYPLSYSEMDVRIKKLVDFNNGFQWNSVIATSASPNTKGLSDCLIPIRQGTDALATSVLNDSLSNAARSVETINGILKEFADTKHTIEDNSIHRLEKIIFKYLNEIIVKDVAFKDTIYTYLKRSGYSENYVKNLRKKEGYIAFFNNGYVRYTGFENGGQGAAVTKSIDACINAADGYFLFDMVHVRDYNYWSACKSGIDKYLNTLK